MVEPRRDPDPGPEASPDRTPDPVLRRIVERFEESTGPVSALRDEIVGSWRRSMAAGLRPERLDVPFDTAHDRRGALHWAAKPILDRVAQDLDGTRTGLLLADHQGRIIDIRAPDADVRRLLDRIYLAPGFLYAETRVGTNAIGTAIETSGSSIVRGPEHFADAFTGMACSATPIRDPNTGRVLGVVDLSSAVDDANGLMMPLVKQAAWDIEQRLLDRVSGEDRALQDAFFRARRSSRGALAIVSPHRLLVNAPAARLLGDSDREWLWERVAGSQGAFEITLPSGRPVMVRTEPVLDDRRRIGVLIELKPMVAWDATTQSRRARLDRPIHGWLSLSETEQAVADLVAEGLTNKEAASRLVLSPHTIDFHLRHVFGKLDVSSRVELTRVVLQHQALGLGGVAPEVDDA